MLRYAIGISYECSLPRTFAMGAKTLMSEVHWLGHEACHRTEVVGGKAASLSRLASLHSVPHGFAIPALHADVDVALPVDIVSSIREAYARLAGHIGENTPSVAVRSSALDEDSAGASFAGQHATYLNVIGEDAVVDAVARCRDSARSVEALAYREQQGLSLEDVRIAVLVQQLIASDVSAVVFSSNPVTNSREEIVINASWGLGESLVGGTVTPDTFIVRKTDLSITQRTIASKEKMTVIVQGGTEEVKVPRALSNEPSLQDAQAIEMAKLALKLEKATDHAVDVECAFAGGELHLLQCRPITTLKD